MSSPLLFTYTDALAAGYGRRDIAGLRPVLHGVYALPDTPLTHELRCRAAALLLPPESVITAGSAAVLLGVPLGSPHRDVEVLVPRAVRRAGIKAWRRPCGADEHVPWQQVRRATPVRAAFDALAHHSLATGVAITDAMLRAGIVQRDEIVDFVLSRSYRNWRKVKRATELLDARAESFQESVVRVELALCGLHPTPQVCVYDAGAFVARLDLAFEEAKVAVEYDGAWHDTFEQRKHDVRRRERLRALGWTVVVVTQDDLHTGTYLAKIKAALGRTD